MKAFKRMGGILIGLALVTALFTVGNYILDSIAERKLRAALAEIPAAPVSFGQLHISLMAGNVELREVTLSQRDSTGGLTDIQGKIGLIRLEGLRWFKLFHGEARAKRLLIRSPEAKLVLPSKNASKNAPRRPERDGLSGGNPFLTRIALAEVRVEKGRFDLVSRKDATKASARGMGLSVRDIVFHTDENRMEYNDSCYLVEIDSLDYTDNAGISRTRVARLATSDAGPVEVLDARIRSLGPRDKIAERMGKVAAVWYDIRLDSLHTSPVNLFRLIKDRRVNIDRVCLRSPEMVLLQDDSYPPAVPYPTFQEGLNSLEIPLRIGQIDAQIRAFTFLWKTTHVSCGTIPMRGVHLNASSVSNARGNTMQMKLKSALTGNARMSLSVATRNDRDESTSGTLLLRSLDASRLDPFVRPLFGATVKADIHQVDGSFKGNKLKMTGEFCMQYDGLSVRACNDVTAPYQFLAKNSGFVNFLADIFLPKANPSGPGKEPKMVEYSFKRDPMKPYPAYLIQNLTNGMLQTLLPGGRIHKKD